MLPRIALEEIFSQLERHLVCKLRLLCLDFYQAAFPLLLRVHSLKHANQVDYQHFLKRNGKHVKGLIIKNPNSYQALLDSGLSLPAAFPQVRAISCPRIPINRLCKAMIEDCLRLKHLKHLSLEYESNEFLQLHFPLFNKLISLHGQFYADQVRMIQQNCKGLKKLLVSLNSINPGVVEAVQSFSEITFEVFILTSEGYKVLLNAKPGNYGWACFTDKGFWADQFQLFLGPDFTKHMASIGLNEHVSFNLNHLRNQSDFEEIIKIPNFVKHFSTLQASYDSGFMLDEEIITKVPSLHLSKGYVYVYEAYAFQASKVSLGSDGDVIFNLKNKSFPNLQHLYISRTIPLEDIRLLPAAFPQLINFFSEVYQHSCLWSKLLEAAPKLKYIHTNHVPPNALEIERQRPFLQFMPYQNIFGNSGDIYDLSEFNKYI